jgi:hypothetical protein
MMINLAPSPYTFYKATTKYDSKPRGAPTGDDVWGDLERPVCGVSDEPTREDTVKLRDLRKGMYKRCLIPFLTLIQAILKAIGTPAHAILKADSRHFNADSRHFNSDAPLLLSRHVRHKGPDKEPRDDR